MRVLYSFAAALTAAALAALVLLVAPASADEAILSIDSAIPSIMPSPSPANAPTESPSWAPTPSPTLTPTHDPEDDAPTAALPVPAPSWAPTRALSLLSDRTGFGAALSTTPSPTTLLAPGLSGYLDAMGLLTDACMLLALVVFAAYVVAPWAAKHRAKRDFSRASSGPGSGDGDDEGLAMVPDRSDPGGRSGGGGGGGGNKGDTWDPSFKASPPPKERPRHQDTQRGKAGKGPGGSGGALAALGTQMGTLASRAGVKAARGGLAGPAAAASDGATSSLMTDDACAEDEAWDEEATSCVI
jgi:hypothetical protein